MKYIDLRPNKQKNFQKIPVDSQILTILEKISKKNPKIRVRDFFFFRGTKQFVQGGEFFELESFRVREFFLLEKYRDF